MTDLGAFVLINVYVPNAGDRKTDKGRTDFKVRFLEALKQKADLFRDAGREVQLLPCWSDIADCVLAHLQNAVQCLRPKTVHAEHLL